MIACIALLLGGCQAADETSTNTKTTAAAAAEEKNASKPLAPEAPEAPTAAGAAAPTQALAQQPFAPPFPERFDLFEPPKRAQGAVRRDDESGDTVELKGFINVNGQRVVLSIGGVVAPLAEGEEKYGVQVKSISPPSVVLQRGRNRWTATLQ